MDWAHHERTLFWPKCWSSAPVRAVLLAGGAVAFVAVAGGFALEISAAPEAQSRVTPPSFYKDVLPILEDHCQSCHRLDESAPMPLLTYEQTKPWAQKIADAVGMKMMPPWFADPRYGHFSNDPPLNWTSGWSMHDPDIVAKMPKPVEIPASGEVEYTYEIVPTHFSEDKWIQTAEVRPSSAQHVHHPGVYIGLPDAKWLRHAPVGEPFTASTLTDPEERPEAHETTSDLLLVYAPGSSPDQWRD